MEDYSKQKHICCICGKEFIGWGNNQEPIKDNGVCCDDCDMSVVLPARIKLLRENR